MNNQRKLSTSLSTIEGQQENDDLPVDLARNDSNDKKPQKMRRVLNTFYSIVIGIMSAIVSKKYLKYNKLLGFMIFLLTYIMNIVLMKDKTSQSQEGSMA